MAKYRMALLVVSLMGLSACGDVVINEGQMGNLYYALHTDYMVDEMSLENVWLIAGVQHRITAGLTSKGASNINSPWTIEHRMFPEANTTIETTEASSDSAMVGDALVTVDVPGEYTLQSWKGRELVDYTLLNFATPDRLDIISYVKQPEEDIFVKQTTQTMQVGIYGQATFIAKPVDADDRELVGDISIQVTSDPEWAAVQVYNLDGVYENGIYARAMPLNMVFVEYGNIKITLTEPLTGLVSELNFEVPYPPD